MTRSDATEIDAVPLEVSAPTGLSNAFLIALDTKLATAAGLAHSAYLVSASYAHQHDGHLLAIIDPTPGAEPALTDALAEAVAFSSLEDSTLDIGFFDASDPITAKFAKHGLRFDLPEAEPMAPGPTSPGTDPSNPPKLR